MDLNQRKKKLKSLLNKLFKNGIKLEEVTDKDEDKLLHPKTLLKFEKLVKRFIERPKILKESAEISERMKERVSERKKKEKLKQEAKNEVFLDKHPQFKQVFKYDTKHNKSGNAELTAKSYMKSRKNRLIKDLNDQFDFSPNFKKKIKEAIMDNDYDIDLLEGFESVSENLIYKKDSDPSDVVLDYGSFDKPDDEYANRLLNRYYNVRTIREAKTKKEKR